MANYISLNDCSLELQKNHKMKIESKLPNVGTTIFTVMSTLAAEHNAINLSQGYPNFDTPDELKERVNHYLMDAKNQYVTMAGLPALREVLAEKIKNLYNQTVDPASEITIVAGATQGIFTTITTFINKGDEVILLEPAYDCYGPSVELVGGKVVPYRMSAPDYKVDWDAVQNLITSKTKMIIINTPQNPIGKTLKKSDLEALAAITRDTNIIVLSDEVYEHLIYDGQEHQSVLRYPELFERSIAVYSFGKTFHSTGWKIGYCVGPKILMDEFRKVHQFNVFCVNSFVQYALADYLQDPAPYMNLPQFYQQKRDFLANALDGSRLKPLPSEGTYFQLFDYSAISDEKDTDFTIRMTTEFGVAAIPPSVFYSNGQQDQVIRLCFAKTEDMLAAAAERLKKM